jgi:hypothetical protein
MNSADEPLPQLKAITLSDDRRDSARGGSRRTNSQALSANPHI